MSEAIMMEEYEEELIQEQGFHITDDNGAVWAARKYREAEREYAYKLEWYTRQIEAAKAKCEGTKARMLAYLQEYSEVVPMHDTKTQRSYAFPGGKMVIKKAHREFRHDDEKVLAALKDQGRIEYIKTIEKLDWAGLKKELNETGELLDGITLEEVPETFSVQIDKEG